MHGRGVLDVGVCGKREIFRINKHKSSVSTGLFELLRESRVVAKRVIPEGYEKTLTTWGRVRAKKTRSESLSKDKIPLVPTSKVPT